MPLDATAAPVHPELSVFRVRDGALERAELIAVKRNGWRRLRFDGQERSVQFDLGRTGQAWNKWHASEVDAVPAAILETCALTAGRRWSEGPRLDLLPVLVTLIEWRDKLVAGTDSGGGI